MHGANGPSEGRIDHLWIGVADLAATRRFYETVAPVLGFELDDRGPERLQIRGGGRTSSFVADGRPPTTNLHLAFSVPDDAEVARFHALATGAGFRDNGAPGERPQYHPGYVGAFVLDPDGTNVEAVNHNR
ncbi:MAG: VOC family protein [Actinomycetota bacterium]